MKLLDECPRGDLIPLKDCKVGHLYRIWARNIKMGVFNGDTGFTGIRRKFGNKFLDTEYHWDTGPPYGTACPFMDLGKVPEVADLFAYLEGREEEDEVVEVGRIRSEKEEV